ncbi:unnamed protein product, partial [Ectocarpus sp. 12 AP-2014]
MVEKRVMNRASVMGFLIYFCAIPQTQRLRESTIKALPLQSPVGSNAECFPVQQFLVDRARGVDKNYKHGKQQLLPPAYEGVPVLSASSPPKATARETPTSDSRQISGSPILCHHDNKMPSSRG